MAELGICAICGLRPATGRDHTPPRGAFAKPLPSDMVAVPACDECNNGSSQRDEKFRSYLSMHVGTDTPATKALWEKRALRGINRNRKLRREILDRTEPCYFTSRGGIITGAGHRFLWDSSAHDAVIERTMRGLYFHHFEEVLGDRVELRTHWFRELTADMLEGFDGWAEGSIGGDQFVYLYGRAAEEPLLSVWLFEFHGKHWAGGQTSPKDDAGCLEP
jgi:hypothetical protein